MSTVDFTPATLSVPIVNLERPRPVRLGAHRRQFAGGNTVQDQTIHIGGPVLN